MEENSHYDNKLEQHVLGAMLLHHNLYYRYASDLSPDHFYFPHHRSIYQAIQLAAPNGQPNIVLVSQQIRSAGLDKINEKETGGTMNFPVYISSLTNPHELSNITSPTFAQYVEHLAEFRKRRILDDTAAKIAGALINNEPLNTITSMMSDQLVNIENVSIQEEYNPLGALESLTQRLEGKRPVETVSFGIKALDDFTSGFVYGEFVIVAAASSMGKTAFALKSYAEHVKIGSYPVFFSLEMSEEDLLCRMIAAEANIDSKKIRGNNLSDKDWQKYHTVIGRFSKNHIMEDDVFNLWAICARIRKYHIKYGSRIFFIDYIQLIEVNLGPRANREREIATITRALKKLTRELKILIIGLSQINRDLKTRKNKRPMLSDLRESGALEQDADAVLFVYRDSYYNPREGFNYYDEAEIIVAKGRGTGTGKVKVGYIGKYVKFTDYYDPEGEKKVSKSESGEANPF